MLRLLRIEQFAVIPALTLELGPGLVVFTGETGAGKSILVDAVALLRGARASPVYIREGASRAYVEGVFAVPPALRPEVEALLAAHGLLDDEDEAGVEEIVLAREIRRSGRHLARVNGRVVPVALLRALGERLVDIHGQAEHLTLLRPSTQRAMLDRFAGLEDLLSQYQERYRAWQEKRRAIQELQERLRTAARQMDLLQYQIREIEEADLQPGEEEALLRERNKLEHAERLARLTQTALQALDGGDLDAASAMDLLGQALDAVQDIVDIDPDLQPVLESLQAALDALDDAARRLHAYADGLEFDPQRLEEIERRLAHIERLKRKYGESIEAVLQYLEQARQELESLVTADERLEAWQRELDALTQDLARLALAISRRRQEAAARLAQAVEAELHALGMPHARFVVQVETRPDPQGLPLPEGERVAFDRYGIDQVTFLIAPNPGEGLHPLAETASGGEIARVMLALRQVLAREDPVPTLIFDEIDQGIGGRMGGVVGRKLRQLARHHQVLCITHLPQLAAYGDQHFKVEKQVQQGRTVTQVFPLEGEARVEELAAMLGDTTARGRATARSLLQRAGQAGPAS